MADYIPPTPPLDLRFRTAYLPPAGALDLRFGIDDEDIDPEIPEEPIPVGISLGIGWGRAAAAARAAAAGWSRRDPAAGIEAGIAWSGMQSAGVRGGLAWAAADAAGADAATRWQSAAAAGADRSAPWGEAGAPGADASLPWASATRRGAEAATPWQRARGLGRSPALPWDGATRQGRAVLVSARRAAQRASIAGVPWGEAIYPPFALPRVWPPQPPPPAPPPCYTPPDGPLVLRFRVAYVPPVVALDMRFCCGRDGRRFDIRETLRVSHSLSVRRLSDDLPIRVRSFSASLDRRSWCWSINLTPGDVASLIALEPTPEGLQEVEVTLDGYAWVAQVDGYQEDRRFGSRNGSVTGKSRTALLDSPWQPARSHIQPSIATAQQLVLQELEGTDFALDWQITDWTVPAGAWSYDNATPIAAIGRIAQAAGAMVQSARDSDTIIIAPRTPVAPWLFDEETPDFTLAGGSWRGKGKRHGGGGRYNAAVVCGEEYGINAILVRTGTSGSPPAPQVTDPLTTDTQPAIARGIQIIADSLMRHEIPITLLLQPSPLAPGLLMPGELGLIEDTIWGEYRAVVDSLTVSAEVDPQTGLVTASQAANLWRYLA